MRRSILVTFLLLSATAWAAPRTEKIDGVPFRCVNAIRFELIRDFAAENRADREAVREYREFVRSAPAYACRSRKYPNVEHVNWCDGSGCTGATATFKLGKCVVSDKWSGQDDQDLIDEAEFRANCLLKADF
jgi:hypothetical protein